MITFIKVLGRTDQARVFMSWLIMIILFVLGLAYLNPDEFVRAPDRVYSGSLVVFIENLTIFPIWSMIFIGTTSFTAYCLLFSHAKLPFGHWSMFIGGIAFTTAMWLGAFLAPHTYVTLSLLSTIVTGMNYLLALSYAERPIG